MQFTAGLMMLASLGATMTPAKGNDAVQKVAQSARYNALVQQLDSEHDRIVDEIITLVEIPAPPFKEAERAKAYEEIQVYIDETMPSIIPFSEVVDTAAYLSDIDGMIVSPWLSRFEGITKSR